LTGTVLLRKVISLKKYEKVAESKILAGAKENYFSFQNIEITISQTLIKIAPVIS